MKKSSRQLEQEIREALAASEPVPYGKRAQQRLLWKGQHIRIDPTPRMIEDFELKRPYVVRRNNHLYTIVQDVWAGNVAHPAIVRGRAVRKASKSVAHATKAGATSDKINIDQLAKMFGLPDWESVDERNQHHYWEMTHGAEDQEKAEQEAQAEVYNQWYDAVEHTADTLFGEHGLEVKPVGKQGTKDRRYDFKIVPANSWNDAANKLRETINGVGDFHFDTIREFLDSGPYTAKQAVLSHLGYIKRYPAVYGGPGANQMYERHWR